MHLRTSDGVRISYERRRGPEPTLVFLHGWANNATVWKPISERLERDQLILDLRGHGESDKPDDPDAYDIERFGADIVELLDHENIERCVLVGHSMGGMIALTIDDERIAGMVLLNTSAGIHDRLPVGPGPFLSRIARLFEENRKLVPADLSEAYRSDFDTFLRGLGGTSLLATIRSFEEMYELDIAERLGRKTTPTLIIAGKGDRVLPPKWSKALERMPKSRFEMIDAHHFSIVDHADEIAARIDAFVESL